MIADGARGFRCEAFAPVFRIEALSNLQLLDIIDQLEKESAIPNQALAWVDDDREL
ncbi:MAG: hypothetical protein H0T95_08590 [Chthoniobacterales bacterium]|nr:hypothetical protein [Chthoniobacterales bacterium]